MFTGIVREIGTVEALERGPDGARLLVASTLAAELADGDSVAVSGACLTVATRSGGAFAADVMNQTLGLTTLGSLKPGDRANLEPAIRAGEPLGGHLVQGHVDETGEVRSVTADGFARRLRVTLPPALRPYVVERGSVAVDGVSLTVAAVADDGFEVSLTPETLERTTLASVAEGDRVNVEVDQVARYVERLMQRFGERGAG